MSDFLLDQYEENVLVVNKEEENFSMEVVILSEVDNKPEEKGFEIKRNKKRQKKRRPLIELNQNLRNGSAKSLKAREQGWKKREAKRKYYGHDVKKSSKRRRVSQNA